MSMAGTKAISAPMDTGWSRPQNIVCHEHNRYTLDDLPPILGSMDDSIRHAFVSGRRQTAGSADVG
jgi:hypothetical protein